LTLAARVAQLGRVSIAGAAALAMAGCELMDAGDNELNGKALFVEKCGACHALDRAGTAGTIGPDLDAAFRRARADGLGQGTIAGIVEEQILHPRRGSRMPAGLVTGEDAEDVAAYVAMVAAVPGRDMGRLADVGVKAGGGGGRLRELPSARRRRLSRDDGTGPRRRARRGLQGDDPSIDRRA
jgi:mono/diheme cytochrome c family protein